MTVLANVFIQYCCFKNWLYRMRMYVNETLHTRSLPCVFIRYLCFKKLIGYDNENQINMHVGSHVFIKYLSS